MNHRADRASSVARIALFISALLVYRPARADEKQACVASFDRAQQLRDEQKLSAAREQLLLCARDRCPGVLRKDCLERLNELSAAFPTIVPSARDSQGHDMSEVRVTVDNTAVTTRLDGRPIPVDPGQHIIRFTAEGKQPAEENVVIKQGEKNRAVIVKLRGLDEQELVAPRTDTPDALAQTPSRRSLPVAGFIVTGVALAAFGSFAYFGATGKSDVDDLKSTCGPTRTCSSSQVDDAKTKLLIADISLGAGVVAAGVATWLFVSHATKSSSTVSRFDVKPVVGGSVAKFTLQF